jgi:hypothetical protein
LNDWIELSSTVDSAVTVGIHACSWEAHTLLSGVDIGAAVVSLATTKPLGVATIAEVADSRLSLTASRVAPSTESSPSDCAVNLQDAINILKMIECHPLYGVGKLLSPYQTLDCGGAHTLGVCYFNDLNRATGLSRSQFGY